MNVELVNVVAGGDLGSSLDLYDLTSSLSQHAPNYEPEISPGLYFELPETAVTVMVFGSGEYHLTGGNNINHVNRSYTEFINIMKSKLNIEINTSKPEIRNLVYQGEFDREFDLKELENNIPNCDYDPEIYPGLYYSNDGTQMAIYRTGRFTITGATNREDVKNIVEEFQSTIVV